MKLITEVEIPELSRKIEYSDKLLFLGSCFSGNIGNKFKEGLFNAMVNPFGVIFNPISIFTLIDRVLSRNFYTNNDWLFENGRYVNLELHGDLSFSSLEEANEKSNNILREVYDFINNSNYLFLTFGTAWVYDYIETNKLAANCHKIPQKRFNKRLLSVAEIYEKATFTLNSLKEINPDVKIVFTVSPVRHLADGAHNNNLSKSTLFLFLNQFREMKGNLYFPSYEIVMDELRDYRFFNSDMIHPNTLATDYVWEIMQNNWLGEKALGVYEKVLKLAKAAQHRPFSVQSDAHQKFLHNSISKLEQLNKEVPILDLSELENVFKEQLL